MGSIFIIIAFREHSATKVLNEQRKASLTDELTGIFNRRAFEQDSQKIQEKGNLLEFTIIMMDVNGLKTVNDSYGHTAGDDLIIGTAQCILEAMNPYGKIYSDKFHLLDPLFFLRGHLALGRVPSFSVQKNRKESGVPS